MIAMFVISGAAHGGVIRYVDDDAPPGGDGTSWNTAYRFLQDGLTDACAGGVAEIHVGQGTYTPDSDEANPDGTGDREATFQLCNGVALMGGYAGFGAKNPDDRDIELYETILSGDLIGDDEPNFQNNDENSYHVVSATSIGISAMLAGFTVKAGNANGTNEHRFGAGMTISESGLTVADCAFRSNYADAGGGGISNSDSETIVTHCSFSGNRATGGGGVENSNGAVRVVRCRFNQNSAAIAGGGILNTLGGEPVITNCLIEDNVAFRGGGIYNTNGSSPQITNCLFVHNLAVANGGGIYNIDSETIVTISNCTFTRHDSAIMSKYSTQTVASCVFWDNALGIVDLNQSTITLVYYSDVQGGWLGGGSNNIDADPLFVDPDGPDNDPNTFDDNDYRLAAGSPCIDAADNTAVPKGIDTDLDGNPCFIDDPCTDDTGNGDPPIVDMGAYEFQVTCPWDFDNSGNVDVKDLLFLLGVWGPCPPKGDCPADFDNSGNVDVKDLLFLLGAWGPCP